MDGTLLDLYFDWHFWMDYLPRLVAEKDGLPLAEAKEKVRTAIEARQGTLQWYCTDYWSQVFDLPVARHKHDLKHMIRPHPGAEAFLERLRALGKRLALVTNAHRDSLMLKLEQTAIGCHFDAILCAHDYGMPKEDARLWTKIRRDFDYAPPRTLLIDDNIRALRAAQQAGIRHLLAASHVSPHMPPVDSEGFSCFHRFEDIMPPPP